MKLIIAGSRTINPNSYLIENLLDYFKIKPTEIVCGLANGVDRAGKKWAEEIKVPVKEFPPSWDAHGKSAGMIRNRRMAEYADALLLIWDGQSRGSANMLDNMVNRKKKVYGVVLGESQ